MYCQNLSKEGTLHKLHRQVGDLKVGLLLVAAVVPCPMLAGSWSQMVQIRCQKQQVVEPEQQPERPAG